MSGTQLPRIPIALRFLGLNPGESPRVEIDYSDGTTAVFDDSNWPEMEPAAAAALGGTNG